jgi:hypothetical protein
MPYKFTEGRRHKFSDARYRVTNWPEYDAALVRIIMTGRRELSPARDGALHSGTPKLAAFALGELGTNVVGKTDNHVAGGSHIAPMTAGGTWRAYMPLL